MFNGGFQGACRNSGSDMGGTGRFRWFGIAEPDHAAEGAASLSIALALMTMIAVGVVFWLWGPTKERPEVD